ncbi:MAG: DUF1836 domain-containing protein [Acutalibacter sp.]|jgi:hypothetical protein
MEPLTAAQAVSDWANEGEHSAPPTWEELPTIPLYMDQVILYLGESLRLFQPEEGGSLLTSSMINNYVKSGLIPHPEKKKYTKEHLAGLMAVSMLKQVLSIQDIQTLFAGKEMTGDTYQLFREAHCRAIQETCRSLQATCDNGEDLKKAALLLAAEANAKRAAAQRILWELAKDTADGDGRSKDGASSKGKE